MATLNPSTSKVTKRVQTADLRSPLHREEARPPGRTHPRTYLRASHPAPHALSSHSYHQPVQVSPTAHSSARGAKQHCQSQGLKNRHPGHALWPRTKAALSYTCLPRSFRACCFPVCLQASHTVTMCDAGPTPDPALSDLQSADLVSGSGAEKVCARSFASDQRLHLIVSRFLAEPAAFRDGDSRDRLCMLRVCAQANGGTFPLAAMIFGWAPVTDQHTHTSPEQHTAQPEHPGAWLQHFASEHADADVWRGLLLSCKAGRGWVLQTARSARLTLDCTFTQPELRRVAPSLRARGTAPTTLVVQCGERSSPQMVCLEQRARACLAALPEHLAGCGSGITELRIEIAEVPVSVSSFLHNVAPHLSNLTALHLDISPFPLPHPSLFPSLTRLTFGAELLNGRWEEGLKAEYAALCSSVAAYMGQLTHLHYRHRAASREPWPVLFTPTTITHTLTSLESSEYLTAELVGLLLDHTPQLQRLAVPGIKRFFEEPDAYRERQWRVQHLCVSLTGVDFSCLAALPRCAAGQLTMVLEEPKLIMSGIEVRSAHKHTHTHTHTHTHASWLIRRARIVW